MGVRRKSRGRLAAVHKAGTDKRNDLLDNTSDISSATISMDQQRLGQMKITDIIVDFGTSKASYQNFGTSSTTNPLLSVIGTGDTQPGYICQVTDAQMGVVTSIETVTLEAITDGSNTDYDLICATGADGKLGTQPTGPAAITNCANIGAEGKHGLQTYDDETLKNKYLYLTAGSGSQARASATIDCSSATIGNIVSGMTALQLKPTTSSAGVNFVFDSTLGWDFRGAALTANKIGMGASTGSGGAFNSRKKLAFAISTALNSNANFATNAASRNVASIGSNEETITVTQDAAPGAKGGENTSIIIVDGYSSSSISATAFSGGIPRTLTGGKVLIRLTGFEVPDDV